MSSQNGVDVYGKIKDEIEVESSFSPSRTYSVRYGEVTWTESIGTMPSIYVVVKYNGIEQTRKRPVIPHYLTEPGVDGLSDFVKVHRAMEELARRNNLI